VNVTEAYNYFVRWANSGGTDNSDWYKDNQATGILTKFKIKKKKDLFYIQILIEYWDKERHYFLIV
jgi:hypothetical protein